MYELRPIYDSRDSFYGKATIIEDGGKKVLQSYWTKVAYISKDKIVVNPNANLSQTTLRHIKEFLRQEKGLDLVKKEVLAYCDNWETTEEF